MIYWPHNPYFNNNRREGPWTQTTIEDLFQSLMLPTWVDEARGKNLLVGTGANLEHIFAHYEDCATKEPGRRQARAELSQQINATIQNIVCDDNGTISSISWSLACPVGNGTSSLCARSEILTDACAGIAFADF